MINFDNLIPVTSVNSRTNYDLRFSAKTGKFNISPQAYDSLNIRDNGFNLMRDGDNPVLVVTPNEEATIHAGRKGSVKGFVFTAKALASMLKLEEDAEFKLVSHENEGVTYITLETINQPEEEVEETSVFN